MLRPHIWRAICITPPNVTGSPSPSLGGAERERERDTEGNLGCECALDLSGCIWTKQKRCWARRGHYQSDTRHQIADEDKTIISYCHILTAPIVHILCLLWSERRIFSRSSIERSITKNKHKSKYIKDSSNLFECTVIHCHDTNVTTTWMNDGEWKILKQPYINNTQRRWDSSSFCRCTYGIDKVCTVKQDIKPVI